MKKKKLELKKKVIASLSDVQKAKIMGGDNAAYTTSFTNCTHFICCGDGCSVEPTNCGASCETCGDTCNSCETCVTCDSCGTCDHSCGQPDTCNTTCC